LDIPIFMQPTTPLSPDQLAAMHLGLWLGALGVVMGIILVGIQIFAALRGNKEKREVSFEVQHPTREEVAAILPRLLKVEDSIVAVRSEINASMGQLNHHGEMRAKDLHDRMNEILSAVSRTEGQVDLIIKQRTYSSKE
jgi:hypothetical protein